MKAIACLPLLLFGLHCGGKAVELPAGSGDGGSSASDGGGMNCPAETTAVHNGDACNWGGSCTFQIDPCHDGYLFPQTCACNGGLVDCTPVTTSCPSETCPPPGNVQEGASCVGNLTCPSSIPVCPGTNGTESCTCQSGSFRCPPPPPCPPPPVSCMLGALCNPPGSSCSTAAGLCGQYQSFSCDPSGHWGSEVDSCTDGATCQMPGGPCGPAYCSCSQGSLLCSVQVCEGGVVDAGMTGDF